MRTVCGQTAESFTEVDGTYGAWIGVVGKALRYYSDGPGIDSR
jgi:hypothetical protein